MCWKKCEQKGKKRTNFEKKRQKNGEFSMEREKKL